MLSKILGIKEVIKKAVQENLLWFLISSLMFFVIFYILTLATTTNHSLSIFIMMNGFSYTIWTFFLLAVIALLLGIYISLAVFSFKIKLKSNKTSGFIGVVGLIVGLFSAGCPMCGAFLFGLFGFPLALFFMPYNGLELRALSVLILVVSIYLISRSLAKCGINRK